MKKFLSILASLMIITSSATGVIACGTNNESKTNSIIENNNKANLLGAAFNEAKAIIFDDQYKLSQKVSNEAISSLEANQFITDYTPQGDLTTKSSVKEVINQYFGNEDDYTSNLDATEDKTVQLNNTKGEVSGLRTFIESKTSNEKIINSILWAVKFIKTIPEFDGLKVTQGVFDILNVIYNNDPQANDWVDGIVDTLASFGIKDLAEKFFDPNAADNVFKNLLPKVEKYFKDYKPIKALRDFTNNFLKANDSKDFQEKLYTQEDSAHKIPKIAEIKVTDTKTEILRAIQRLLEHVFVFPEHHEDVFKDIDHDSLSGVSLTLADFGSALIKKKPLKLKKGWDQGDNLYQVVLESMRAFTILNAYFSLFDGIKTHEVKDSHHLFADDKDNFAYMAQIADQTQTLGQSAYVDNQAINLNYFLANLDYYFGSLYLENKTGAFRFIQGLFLLLNDPTSVEDASDETYQSRQSSISSVLFEMILFIGTQQVEPKSQVTNPFWKIYNSIASTTLDQQFRSMLMSLVNGDSYDTLLKLAGGVLKTLIEADTTGILAFIKPYLKDLQTILQNARQNPEFVNNTLFFLLNGDLRPFLNGTEFITNDLFNRWFLSEQKVNLMTFLAKPVVEIIGIFKPKVYESSLGEMYYNRSIPGLVRQLNLYFNQLDANADLDPALGAYQTSKANTVVTKDTKFVANENLHFMDLDLKLSSLGVVITKIIGDENGKENIVSTTIEALKKPDMTNNQQGFVAKLGLNLPEVFKALGMSGDNTVEAESFLGVLLSWLLPLAKPNKDGKITVDTSKGSNDLKINLIWTWLLNLTDVVVQLDEIYPHYEVAILNLLRDPEIFSFKFDPKSINYDNDGRTIKDFKFEVTFNNPVTHKSKDQYTFHVARQTKQKTFRFTSVTKLVSQEPKPEQPKQNNQKGITK